jgi:peptide/nickel transport system substrate-binding protein
MDSESFSRRQFLRVVGGASAVGAGGLLAACGSSSSSSTSSTSSLRTSGKPKRGGTITLATTGGASSDTLDGNATVTNPDFCRAPQLYDTLVEWNANYKPYLHLAEELTPNADSSVWTIRVRKGVEFHNGKPFTIDDVLFTFQRILSKDLTAAATLSVMDLKNAKKLDAYTVSIPMHFPYSIMLWALTFNGQVSIVPVGYNPKKPVGTGPFKYQSFTPGETSTFARNDNYWISGKPYADSVVITEYDDQPSQINALLSGQATCCDQLSFAGVAPVRAGGKVANVWGSPGWVPFTMRLDQAPFSDNNVRQAMRYAVARPEYQKIVYGGYGLLGNDMFGITDVEYDHALPQRVYDPEKAKSLLKKAGHDTLNVTLVTADIHTGAIEGATVLKQQAAAAGINISLEQLTSTAYQAGYLKWTFSQDWWDGAPYLPQCGYSSVPGAPWDETKWATSQYGPKYFSLYKQALAQPLDGPKQTEIVHELMTMDYDYGGYIIPAFNPIIVGQSPSLKGVVTQKTGTPWIEYRFRDYWLA